MHEHESSKDQGFEQFACVYLSVKKTTMFWNGLQGQQVFGMKLCALFYSCWMSRMFSLTEMSLLEQQVSFPTVKQIRQLKAIAASCNRNREQWMFGLCNQEPECAENHLSRWGSYAFQTCSTQGSQFYGVESTLAWEKFQKIFCHSMRFPQELRLF